MVHTEDELTRDVAKISTRVIVRKMSHEILLHLPGAVCDGWDRYTPQLKFQHATAAIIGGQSRRSTEDLGR